MDSGLLYVIANGLWLAGGASPAGAFARALHDPRRTQQALLRSLLRDNADTEYGRRHGFGRMGTVREYQDGVPVVRYEDIARDIEEIKRGQPRVLTAEPVLMLEKTGGSTAASKYIPYTARLKREFAAAVAPWMADLYGRRPRLLAQGAYWSVSPLASERERTEGGLPVGFDEDTDYFGPVARRLLRRLMLTPAELPRVSSIDSSRYVTLRFLLQTERLGFVSIWNPSFLCLLMQALDRHADRLIWDIRQGTLSPPDPLPPDLQALLARPLRSRPGRARQLQAIRQAHGGVLPPDRIWPYLGVVSAWTEAGAARSVPELRRRFPQAEIQPKGLLATEGVVSLPLTGYPGAALAVTSHFLEFVDEESPAARPLLCDELEPGPIYTVLLTTGGGLYRYALGDRLRVIGRVQATPLVEFLGKAGQVSDLCGEKLHEGRVRDVLDACFNELAISPVFAMLAPEWGEPPAYVLFLECPVLAPEQREALAARVEAMLAEGHHYAYCRRLGQLGPLRLFPLAEGGADAYLERCARLGQRRGSIKPVALHTRPDWAKYLPACCSSV